LIAVDEMENASIHYKKFRELGGGKLFLLISQAIDNHENN
jgi:hypothetical protein